VFQSCIQRINSIHKTHLVGGFAIIVIPLKIELFDDVSVFYFPSGTSAGVAVYSEHLAFLGELRRILLHMFSWQNVISFDEPG